jgi:glucans biosynthesis protein C
MKGLIANTMSDRRYDIDWLRIMAILAVFFFHCTRFFDTEDWHVKDAAQSEVLFISIRCLIWPWVMELFFLISGLGTWYALKPGQTGTYVWQRIKRLLVPLYTVGFLILLPPQFYLELYTNAGFRGGFWQFSGRYFPSVSLPRMTQDPGTLLPLPFSGHLWFLQYLFLMSLMSLPLLLYLKSTPGQRGISKLAGCCERRGGIFLFVLPLSLVLLGCRGLFQAARSWADFLWYTVFFVIGFVMAADKRFSQSVKRHAWIGLALWMVGIGGVGLLVLLCAYDPFPGRESFSLLYTLYQIAWSLTSWSAVVFVLGLGARHLNRNHRVLAYVNEAVLPFYLFHQTVLLWVGWYVTRWNTDALPKFLTIAVLSFLLIMLLYEGLVRRFNILRFLFGMRAQQTLPQAVMVEATEDRP